MKNDYDRIEAALRFLDDHVDDQPPLDALAEHLGLSPFHTQRLFKRWAGVSPKRFLQFATVEHAKHRLAEDQNLLDTSFDVGLSGPGRLHDHFVAVEAMTPGEFKTRGRDVEIRYGSAETPFGPAFLASTPIGICRLGFLASPREIESELAATRKRFPGATLIADSAGADARLREVFTERNGGDSSIPLDVRGTNFQIQVWKALLRIPSGSVASYRRIARSLGRPTASRAVANAVAANPVVYLIPCHRVIRSLGAWGGYRYGADRKWALLIWEETRVERAG